MLPAPTYLHCKKQTNKKTEEKFIATAVRTQLRSWRIFEPASSLIVNNS
jgi:hypothetical protein